MERIGFGGNVMAPKRILVVDDKEDIRTLLRHFFEHEGFEVFEAADGAKALEMVRKEQFDVVLTDLKMPVPDGLEVLKEVRHLCPETTVLILTGYPTIESTVKALELGCDGYLAKPIKLNRLKDLIQEGLAKRKWKVTT
jgi:DNA-binding response OmpR family regulator